MESPGTKLKRLRLEKGISLEEVHKKTKVHLDILKAIEEDNLINFSPVYLKGFLKIYCKFLGVDPHDYIPDYKEPEYKAVLADKLKESSKKSVSFFQVASNVIGYLKPYLENLKRKNIIVALVVIIGVILFFKLGKTVSTKGTSAIKISRTATTAKTNDKKTQTTKVSQSSSATTEAQPSQSTIAIPQDKSVTVIKLGIRAKEDCWIQLKADGRMVFQNILKKGRFESWQADQRIEFSLGNAGVVDLEVNGKLVSNLGRRGQVIKNIVITKEGLTIPR
jgi:cytoskeletal protein RodZ